MRTLISKPKFFLLLIILLGVFLRFYQLSHYPVQLNHDEITQLYDAISIAQTGKDIYGNFLPFIFPSISDFKPPFYTYITSLFYLMVGGGELTIRLPGVLFGVLMIPAVFLFCLKLLKNRSIALWAAFFTAIAPFEIFFSRKSFENGAGIFLMLLGFSFLLIYLEKKRLVYVFSAAVIFAAAMYTYFSHTVIIPLLLSVFVLLFRESFLKKVKRFFGPLLLFLGLVLPLLLLIFVNSDSRFRTQTVFIGQDVNLGREIDYSKTSNETVDRILKNKVTLDYIFNRYLQQFSPIYLFVDGLDFTNQGFFGVGPLLFIELPFVILGIIYLFKSTKLQKQGKFIAAWIIFGMLPSGLTFEYHSPHRVVMVFTALNIIAAIGVYWAILLLRGNKFFYAAATFFTALLILNLIYFANMYFVNFPFEKSQYMQYPFKEVALFAWSQYQNFDHIVFDPKFGDIEPEIGVGAHYYFAYYGKIAPLQFQKQYHAGSKPREVLFDKFSIREVYWPTDQDLKNTLIIASPWSVPEKDIADKSKIIKRFNFYNGKLAFYAIKL